MSISEAGVVTALTVGTSQVAANALGKSGIAVVTVSSGAVGSGTVGSGAGSSGTVATVTVTAPSAKVKAGSTMQLTATAKDENGNVVHHDAFYWSSSNTDKATVSSSGVVSGKRQGDVTITASTSQSGGKSGSLQIEVKK